MFYLVWKNYHKSTTVIIAASYKAAVETLKEKIKEGGPATVVAFVEAQEIDFPPAWKELHQARVRANKIAQFAFLIKYHSDRNPDEKFLIPCSGNHNDFGNEPDCDICLNCHSVPANGMSWEKLYERSEKHALPFQ